MEEINRSGGNAGACHGQMYNMGTLLRARLGGAEAQVSARDCRGRAAPAVDGGDRARHRHRHHPARDDRAAQGRSLCRRRPEGVDLARAALRPDDPARADHAACRGQAQVGGHVGLLSRARPGDRQGAHGAADPQHGQSRDQRAVLRSARDSGGEPDRRGGQGLSLHPRRTQCRAHADRRRMHRRWLLVHRARRQVRRRAGRVRAADRQEPGGRLSRSPKPTWRSRRPI